ncbi:hypothetical protein RCG23_04935 [Neobacillus sp. PS3-34]|uniref:hypothetical protein n=1 Tax=Neobacillus sp. PS3-34 TaxID=3070678 RepID=UPI0027DF47E5|nr:hypothetical protein [Neobacillus sp. PS3-34]WML49378.1 hypothetical protein RCG23_04935 [Neobacillus sp. PS3-34]
MMENSNLTPDTKNAVARILFAIVDYNLSEFDFLSLAPKNKKFSVWLKSENIISYKGVRICFKENAVSVDIFVNIEMTENIIEKLTSFQKRIFLDTKDLTGIFVRKVNIVLLNILQKKQKTQ